MFSYVDLVRAEITLEADKQFNISFPEDKEDSWQTLGDLARLVATLSCGKVNEAHAFDWIRTFMVENYGVSMELTPSSMHFGDYDQVTGWFFARKRDRSGK